MSKKPVIQVPASPFIVLAKTEKDKDTAYGCWCRTKAVHDMLNEYIYL